MKSPEFVTHGTSSEKDAETIRNEGFKAQEGRATVSGDLIYSYAWATETARRKGSKSESAVSEETGGRMIIMGVPEGKSVDYATHTDIEVDETRKEISGYPAKYESGRRQLGIYDETTANERKEKKREIERAKEELKELSQQMHELLTLHGLDSGAIHSKDDLAEAIKGFNINEKIEILTKAEELDRQRAEKRQEAERDISLPQENVLMSVRPSEALGTKLEELKQQIAGLDTVDVEKFTEELSTIIEADKENFVASGLDVREVVGHLLETTLEAEIVNMVRNLALDVQRANGFVVYNRERDERLEKPVDREELAKKLKQAKALVDDEAFDIGAPALNRYLRTSIDRLAQELDAG